MKDKKMIKISLIKLFAEIINSRDIAVKLESIIKKDDSESFVLDFSNIKFISRSAAHALLLLKEKSLNKDKKYIYFENASKDVSEMLRIVSANRVYPKKKKPDFNPKRIKIESLLKAI